MIILLTILLLLYCKFMKTILLFSGEGPFASVTGLLRELLYRGTSPVSPMYRHAVCGGHP